MNITESRRCWKAGMGVLKEWAWEIHILKILVMD